MEAASGASQPLNLCHVQTKACILNRAHALLHSLALLYLIHFRLSHLIFLLAQHDGTAAPIILWLLIFSAELLLSFMWLQGTAFGWRPVRRTVFPERLPGEEELPAIDVFICTTDPEKEPTLGVMNTVLSAMALDYPPQKLNVYVSDDGGFSETLSGLREAAKFAKTWIPFCRTYGITCGCPQAYLSEADHSDQEDQLPPDNLFIEERRKIQEGYDLFKANILKGRDNKSSSLLYHDGEAGTSKDHKSSIELRVSGTMSNSPYILVLDCDMYCNDRSSAKQSMCFHLDPKTSQSSFAFVQFPQRFHNISKNDIYDSHLRSTFNDGLRGPILSGTGFYIKREALCNSPSFSQDISEVRTLYGRSNVFITKLNQGYKLDDFTSLPWSLQDEARSLASCTYEEETKWGQEVGFMYGSVVEDFFTSLHRLHRQGWTSAYLDPPRPQFLGNGVTSLNDLLVQGTRWSSGLIDVALSKYTPLKYDTSSKMSLLQTMCYSLLALFPLYCLPLWCFATIPQLCLLNDIALYPKAVTCHLYGTLDAVLKKIGYREASFMPTNKALDEEQVKLYHAGKFNFQASDMLVGPLVFVVTLNVISLVFGSARAFFFNDWDRMFIQICMSFYVTIMSWPVIEAMLIRKDKGRIGFEVTLKWAGLCLGVLLLGSVLIRPV
uniref:Uncharacterized protein n=1 Tax=Kalanchoe fedtschenkoi TaxID=63787 RepID=A0A7N0V4T5_KALFE